MTTAARTVRDMLLDADRLTAIWAAECAIGTRRTGFEEITAQLEAAIGQRGVRLARARLALVEPRSESPLETGVRLVVHDAGLPLPEVQIVVLGGAYRIDLGYRRFRLGIGCDGRIHGEVSAVYTDRVRANALDGAGWRLLRFTWHDLIARPLLRFTWHDLIARPHYIVDTIHRSLRSAA